MNKVVEVVVNDVSNQMVIRDFDLIVEAKDEQLPYSISFNFIEKLFFENNDTNSDVLINLINLIGKECTIYPRKMESVMGKVSKINLIGFDNNLIQHKLDVKEISKIHI